MPFYIFYVELDDLLKYGRFITPHGTIVDFTQYIITHLFGERFANKIM